MKKTLTRQIVVAVLVLAFATAGVPGCPRDSSEH
jgi:hypothetical protein